MQTSYKFFYIVCIFIQSFNNANVPLFISAMILVDLKYKFSDPPLLEMHLYLMAINLTQYY